jgi:hypothetical protein
VKTRKAEIEEILTAAHVELSTSGGSCHMESNDFSPKEIVSCRNV